MTEDNVELTQKEAIELQKKQRVLQRKQVELKMLQESLQKQFSDLSAKYDLDSEKNYTYKEGMLVSYE